MKKHIFLNKLLLLKLCAILASLMLLIFSFKYINNKNYNSLMNTYYSKFNNCEFQAAKKIIEDKNLTTFINNKKITQDLKTYFTSIVNILCSNMKSGNLNTTDSLNILKEISTYEILDYSLEKLIFTLDSTYTPNTEHSYCAFLKIGEEYCKYNEFINALTILRKIPNSNNLYYSKAQNLINDCIENYKQSLFTEADNLVKDDYYTKAIELLSNADENIVGTDNVEIKNKINAISDLKEEYLASLSNNNSSSVMSESISFDTINKLNIESSTSYLIFVNLSEQQVYVYNGFINNWNLKNRYICSSGIENEPTPTGIFTISNRGDWFFSKDYQQGGKYWVQFSGDYLFHSLPYNENQDEILDYTLGKPASHGCIRLNTEDAKWIYDNVPDNTKVIIQ